MKVAFTQRATTLIKSISSSFPRNCEHATSHVDINAPCHSEAPRNVFLHCFLELSSCTIMGAGEIDAMLWCVCTAVVVGNDLGSTPSLRAHSEDFPKHP